MKMFHKKTGVIICAVFLFFMLFAGCGSRTATVQKVDTAMGTIVSQTLYLKSETNPESGEKIAGEIISLVDRLEQEVLSRRLAETEIYRINESAGKTAGVQVSEKLAGILEKCLQVSVASEGAFDITIGEVVRLWDIDTWAGAEDTSGFAIPEDDAIRSALADSGFGKISLEKNQISMPENLQLDMGAVGKGVALDEIRVFLKEQKEVEGAVISVGGSILTYGSKPDGGAWNVAIVNPMNPSDNIGMLKLTGEWCVSTSGDYERYVEVNGERFHHIIDPSTGRPAESGIRSVTILTRDGMYSDALSTACFVLGEEKGMELARKFGAEALFVAEDGEISMTDGMKEYFQDL